MDGPIANVLPLLLLIVASVFLYRFLKRTDREARERYEREQRAKADGGTQP